MTTKRTAHTMVTVAQSFHRGAFHEVRAALNAIQQAAASGRLDRGEQALLLELAEYGLFYTSFYHQLVRDMHTPRQPSRSSQE